MLDLLFGFGLRIGRLKYFLLSIALGIVNGVLAIPVVYDAFRHGMKAPQISDNLWSMGWPIILFACFCMWGNYMLASMRFRDIGWDPIIMVSCWITLVVVDPLIASRVPALSLPKHHGTVIGGLINFGLIIVLLFWPSGDHTSAPPAFDGPAPLQPRGSNRTTISSERLTSATTQFGRRA